MLPEPKSGFIGWNTGDRDIDGITSKRDARRNVHRYGDRTGRKHAKSKSGKRSPICNLWHRAGDCEFGWGWKHCAAHVPGIAGPMDGMEYVPPQTGCASVNSGFGVRCRFFAPRDSFLGRALFVVILVTMAHQFEWGWLRYFTSEAILQISAFLGMATDRVSFDTIRVQGQLFRFVISCTLVDVFLGTIPLVWNLQKSTSRNLSILAALAAALFTFNVLRLEIAQLLYARGMPWILADDVLAGFAYFAIWLVIARRPGLVGIRVVMLSVG